MDDIFGWDSFFERGPKTLRRPDRSRRSAGRRGSFGEREEKKKNGTGRGNFVLYNLVEG
jgi:hypothetical protein